MEKAKGVTGTVEKQFGDVTISLTSVLETYSGEIPKALNYSLEKPSLENDPATNC
jgi:hypothetical protein